MNLLYPLIKILGLLISAHKRNSIILEIKPSVVFFSADHADSDSPLSPIDFGNSAVDYSTYINQLTAVGIQGGFFVEPNIDEIKGASKAGAQSVLINCSGFTTARNMDDAQMELDRIDKATQFALKQNLVVIAGRGINYKNVKPLNELNVFDEFIVGNAVCIRAMLVGFEKAVSEMKHLLEK